MDLSRRQFFKVAGIGLAGSSLGAGHGPDAGLRRAGAPLQARPHHETRNTCPYCSVGCGVIMYSQGDAAKNVAQSIIHIEGDADHPVNRGTLCPKAQACWTSFTAPPPAVPAGAQARQQRMDAHVLG
jgi:formate dehydrogenase major subunit